jgi:hypothetical protein
MSPRAVRAAIAGLGCLVACAATRVPATGPTATTAGDRDASAAVAVLADQGAHGDATDGGPGSPGVAEAAVVSVARDASVADDEGDAGAKLVFDLAAARSGESKVAVLVNVEAFRASTAGRQLGAVFNAMKLQEQVGHVDELGVAWLLYTGPSLLNSKHGTLLMFCAASDAKIDRWLDARRVDPHDNPVDAGAGVHAVVGRADNAPRVFLRPQSHVVAMVPPELGTEAAAALQGARIPAHADPREAFRFRAKNPSRVMSELPASVTEVRFWIAPRKDQGADFFFETDTPGATIVAQQLHDFLDKEIDPSTRTATLGVFDHPDISTDGDVAKVHIRATEAQLWAILQPILAEFR